MFNRAIMALLVLISISTILITVFAVSENNHPSNNLGSYPSQTTSPSSTTINTNQASVSYKTKNHNLENPLKTLSIISPAEAKKIAAKYIEQPGASPGTPKLVKEDGKRVYIVPVIYKAQNVGEIDLDAHTGKNLGGAGGAPKN
jgi:hypothetical protein